jgi:hypothetical protein
MLSRVVYSGSHTGDCLDSGLVEALHREVEDLPRELSQPTQDFLKSLSNLVKVALKHNLPIEF